MFGRKTQVQLPPATLNLASLYLLLLVLSCQSARVHLTTQRSDNGSTSFSLTDNGQLGFVTDIIVKDLHSGIEVWRVENLYDYYAKHPENDFRHFVYGQDFPGALLVTRPAPLQQSREYVLILHAMGRDSYLRLEFIYK